MYFEKVFAAALPIVWLHIDQAYATSLYIESVDVKTSNCWFCGMTYGSLRLMVYKLFLIFHIDFTLKVFTQVEINKLQIVV